MLCKFCLVKLIGKLQDGTVFLKKGHGDSQNDLFEFKTDEGTPFFLIAHFWLCDLQLRITELVLV